MTDKFNDNDKQKEIDLFFDKFEEVNTGFDKITQDFDKSLNKPEIQNDVEGKDAKVKVGSGLEPEPIAATSRMDRLSQSKPRKLFSTITEKTSATKNRIFSGKPAEAGSNETGSSSSKEVSMTKKNNNKDKKKKYKVNKKQFFKFITVIFIAVVLVLGGLITSVVIAAPPIEPDKIYTLLSENSVLYDDAGNIIDNLLTSDSLSSDGRRTNVSYTDLPSNLVNAFIAIEDKTFWEHNGFNYIRMFGAIKESVFEGGSISGTSTITQQLARNLWLADSKTDRTITRKLTEAYYALQLEKHLSKEQIIEAYLNTIFLGFGTNGVQAASQTYFSKDVADLTLVECAALASLPKAPDRFALLKRYDSSQVGDDNPNIIRRGETFTLVFNDAVTERKNLVLSFMKDQGMISNEEYDDAVAFDLKTAMNPSEDSLKDISSYFADYAIEDVIKGLMAEFNVEESEAKQMIYNNGLRIYTTMNSSMQKIVEKEFAINSNFPKVTGIKKDGAGNIIGANGKVLLFSYNNYFDGEGNFILSPEEYIVGEDGGLTLLKSKRLNFYKTEVNGAVDYSVEFKDMYIEQDGVFYVINGGVIQLPQKYKDKDAEGNLIIPAEFFESTPDFFEFASNGLILSKGNYALKQKVVQPQSAMVIFDYKTGGIKAMVGGRNVEGRLLFNRATGTRQPGSAIKPMGVYGPALQSGVNGANANIANTDSEGNGYGKLWTAASVIDDAPLTIQGKLWPRNWYSGYRGLYTLRESVEQSVNVNAVKVFNEIGVADSVSFLKKLGVTSIVESGDVNDMNAAALALGGMSYGISPLQMAAGYGAFANQGLFTEPIAYTKVTNKRGEIILENISEKTQAMDKGVSFIMTDILRTTVSNGIAKAAAIGSQPVAGKTGTTTDNYDAWFVGFTPQYSAAVWIGNDVNIELSQGSAAASKVWSKIMKQVHSGIPTGSFPTADNVISVAVDTKSGRLPSELSSLDPRGTVRNEYFVRGTQPTTYDNVHTSVVACNDSGYLATPYCPTPVNKVVVHRPNGYVSGVGDAGYGAPAYYCHLHNLDPVTYPINPSETLNTDFGGNNGTGNDNDNSDSGNGNGNNGNENGNGNSEGNDTRPGWLDLLN